jgi:hypothetical protein
MASTSAAFTAAQSWLLSAPESTAAIRNQLELANQQWMFVRAALRGLRPGVADPQEARHVFAASERILDAMEVVTGEYARLA